MTDMFLLIRVRYSLIRLYLQTLGHAEQLKVWNVLLDKKNVMKTHYAQPVTRYVNRSYAKFVSGVRIFITEVAKHDLQLEASSALNYVPNVIRDLRR